MMQIPKLGKLAALKTLSERCASAACSVLVALGLAAAVMLLAGPSPVDAESTTAREPATIFATIPASGGAVVAVVSDAVGSPVADGTPVRFMLSTAETPAATCVRTSAGRAIWLMPPPEAGAIVLVTTDWNGDGQQSNCDSAGEQQLHSFVQVGGTSRPAFASPPVYSVGPPRLAFTVFNGGTLRELGGSLAAASASGAWAQSATGDFVVYVFRGPAFANELFTTAFPNGIGASTALMLVAD